LSADNSALGACREHIYDMVMMYVKRCGLVSVTSPKAVTGGVCMYASEKGGCGKPAVLAVFCCEMPGTLEEGDRQALNWIAGRLSAGHKNLIFRVNAKQARPPLRRTFEPPKHT